MLAVTLSLYLLIGVLVAVARWRQASLAQAALTLALWPIFAPFVLAELQQAPARPASPLESRVRDAVRSVIDGIERLDGGPKDALVEEVAKVRALSTRLQAEARRVDSMSAALTEPSLRKTTTATRLEELRDAGRDELLAGIAKLEAMASQLVLLRFADPNTVDAGPSVEALAAGIDAVAEAFQLA